MEKHICSIASGACVSCGTCQAVCPTKAVRNGGGLYWIEAEKCVGCDKCFHLCPKQCIFREPPLS